MYKVKLEKFEGPLDLLLELIEAEKLEITEISLASITNQYLEYIQDHPQITASNLADFLFIAAKLLLLKSRALVIDLSEEEEEDLEELQEKLIIYQRYRRLAQKLDKLIKKREFFIVPQVSKIEKAVFLPPLEIKGGLDLKRYYLSFLKGEDYIVPLKRERIEDAVSIEEKMEWIRGRLAKKMSLNFNELLSREKVELRTELIVSFLALLELAKREEVELIQERIYGKIIILK